MKQLKVKNQWLQQKLDKIHGWKELVLVLVFIIIAGIALLLATKVSAL